MVVQCWALATANVERKIDRQGTPLKEFSS